MCSLKNHPSPVYQLSSLTKRKENIMSQKKLFQYAIWYRDPKDSEKDELITSSVDTVEALDEEHVKRIALRTLAPKWDKKIAYIKIDVRPF